MTRRAAFYDTPWVWSDDEHDPVPANVRPVVNRLRQALAVGDTAELDQALAEELNQNTVRWIAQTCIQSLHLDVRGPPGHVSPEELRARRRRRRARLRA